MMALINLCKLEDVKNLIESKETIIKDNTALQDIIPAVSAQIEKHIGRFVEKTTHVEVFDVDTKVDLVFWLAGYPVTSITDIKQNLDRDFTSTADIMDSDTYGVKTATGRVRFEAGYLYTGFQTLQITYVGGIATDTEDLKTTDVSTDGLILRKAATRQCAYLVNTRTQIGATNVDGGQLGGVSWVTGEDLLPEVVKLLYPLRKLF
jgi:hypothetical protein